MATPIDFNKNPPFPLLNTDVLGEIFSHLAPDLHSMESQKVARRNLLKIALLSRQLTEPALRVLWRSIDTLLPLLKLIPEFQERNGQYIVWSMTGTSPASWGRFYYYASKVQEFKYSRPILVNPLTYGCVSRVLRMQSILPNLQTLLIDLRNVTSTQDLECLLTFVLCDYGLKRVELWSPDDDLDTPLLLSTINLCCHNVESVQVHGHASTASLDAICSFRALSRFDFRPRAMADEQSHLLLLKSLSRATELQEINLALCNEEDLAHDNDPYRFPIPCVTSDFSSLRRLGICGVKSSIRYFLGVLQATALQDIDLHIINNYTKNRRDEIKLLITQIADSAWWCQSLTSLKIRFKTACPSDFKPLEDLIIPLADLTSLQELVFSIDTPLQGDLYRTVVEAARGVVNTSKIIRHLISLTHLRHLCLPTNCKASVRDIHDLASHLPKLRILRISILMRNIPPLAALRPLSHQLKVLDTGYFESLSIHNLGDAMLLCGHLRRMFPLLVIMASNGSTTGPTLRQVFGMVRFEKGIKLEG